MADRIQFRRDTAARWSQYNPILLEGEIGVVTDNPNQYKIGDGINAWNSLPLRGFDGTVVQETGNAEDAVMSQKSVSNNLNVIKSEVIAATLNGNISTGNIWSNTNAANSYKHILIPISYYVGMKITVKGDSTYKYYAWLSSFEENEGETPSYVGEATRIAGYPTNIVIPEGANYLYLSVADEDGVAYLPTEITVDGYNLELSIRKEIINIQKKFSQDITDVKTLVNDNVEELRDEIERTANEIEVIVRRGNISSISGTWRNVDDNPNTYKNIFIPISLYVGKRITVIGNSGYKYHAFLTSFERHQEDTPSYVSGTSLKGGYPTNSIIPEGAQYLYLSVSGEDGVVYLPTTVTIDNAPLEMYMWEAINNLKDTQATLTENQDSIKEDIYVLDYTVYGDEQRNIPLTGDDVKNGNISGGEQRWVNLSDPDTYKHVVIPISIYVGRTVTAIGDSDYKYYAWLTDIDNVVENAAPAYLGGTGRYAGYPNGVTVPSGANYLYLSVADSDGIAHLPTVTLSEQYGLVSKIGSNKKGTPGEKVVFSVSVNCHIDTSTDETSDITEDNQNDWATLSLPSSYTLDKLCPLIIYCHGAGGSVKENGSGESDARVPFWNHYGYAVLQVNGLPSPFQTTVIKGGGFGTPIAINCYYKAYLYAIENYNLAPNCYLIGESMGGLTALNLMQNTPMQIRAIALDAPLVSIDNLWKSPTWAQAGDYKNTVWYLLAKMYNFSFEELNEAHSTDYTLDTFPFNTDDSGYNSTYVQELYSYNKAKIAGFDPFIPTSKNGETEYKYTRCPVKIWRGSGDSATGRLPYCKNLVSKVRNAYCKIEEKYPPYSRHVLSTGTTSDGISQVTVDNKQYSIYLEEIRIWLEGF